MNKLQEELVKEKDTNPIVVFTDEFHNNVLLYDNNYLEWLERKLLDDKE